MTRVALVQEASPDDEPIDERRERITEAVRHAAVDADLVVLPELWPVGYFAFDHYDAAAEARDGTTVASMSAVARELGVHVHVGSYVERLPDGALQNSSALLDPTGAVVHRYSKIHVFGYQSLEAQLLRPGSRLQAHRAEFGTVAATTCYDLRFGRLWDGLATLGAEIVIVPAAWPAARRAHWQLLTSARAVEQQVFVIACNAAGRQRDIELAGTSRVVDPWGTVVAEAGPGPEVLHCEVDVGLVRQVRAEFPVLADRVEEYELVAPTER
jgi:predicted amidohydrolase